MGDSKKPPDLPKSDGSLNSNPDKIFLYSHDHKYDWYKLIIQAKPSKATDADDATRKPFVRALAVSRLLGEITNHSKDITEVRRLNRMKFLVVCSTAGCANKIVQNEKVKQSFDAFIPQIYLFRTAIVRDVDVDIDGEPITNQEILENIDTGNFKLRSVERLNRKVVTPGAEAVYVPSTSIKLVFEGQEMPTYIYLWYTRLSCEPFVQNPIQCFTCYKFGHVSKHCSTRSTLCKKCYQIEENNHVCDLINLKCLNCHGPHNVSSKNCPEYDRQKNIKILMSTRNLCFPEAADLVPSAKRMYSTQTKNSFEVLRDVPQDFAQFPEMKNKYHRGQRNFNKYSPPAISNIGKRKPSYNSSHANDAASKKNRTDSTNLALHEKMRNITLSQQYHSDKEISHMYYKNAENIKSNVQSTESNISQTSAPEDSQTSPLLDLMKTIDKENEDFTMLNNEENETNIIVNKVQNQENLNSYANVLSPDLSY